jgi:hypothetical protein
VITTVRVTFFRWLPRMAMMNTISVAVAGKWLALGLVPDAGHLQ